MNIKLDTTKAYDLSSLNHKDLKVIVAYLNETKSKSFTEYDIQWLSGYLVDNYLIHDVSIGFPEKYWYYKSKNKVENSDIIKVKQLSDLEVKENIDKPKQYQIGIDTFERAEANLPKDHLISCIKFNIDKYTWREKKQDIEDFEKIIAYAKKGIEILKKHE